MYHISDMWGFRMCAEHGASLAGESPATGIYRQV